MAAIAGASTNPRWSDAQLAAFAELVVSGRVIDVEVGRDPAVGWLYTYVTLDVEAVHKGVLTTNRIVIKQLGGEENGAGLSVVGQPRFAVGEDVLLFLESRPRDGSLYTSAFWQGKWSVAVDPATGARVANRIVDPHPGAFAVSETRAVQALEAIVRASSADVRAPGFVVDPGDYRVRQPYVLPDTPARWMESNILVRVAPGGQPGLSGGGFSQIAGSRAQWNSAGAAIALSDGGFGPGRCLNSNPADGRITVSFDDPCEEVSNSGSTVGYAQYYWTSSGSQTVNGVMFRRILTAAITTNNTTNSRNFSTSGPCFQSLMTHEFGHAVGFAHSSQTSSIMYPSISNACAFGALPLNASDVDGLRFVYPGGAGPAPTPTPPPPTPSPTAPGPPTNVQASATTLFVNVSWTAPSSGSTPTSYRLDFYSGATVAASVTVGAVTSTTVAVPPGVVGTFSVRVTGIAGALVGTPSAAATFTIGGGTTPPGPCVAPSAPTGVGGSVAGGIATVSWQPSSGATSYIVRAGSSPGRSDYYNGNVGNSTMVTAVVAPGFRGYVRVVAVSSCGQSGESAEFLLTDGSGGGLDLEITLTWDSSADLDIHLVEPNGTHVYYLNRNGPTASLSLDDVDGFGPETITVPAGRAAAGTYQVYLHSYRGVLSNATVAIRVRGGTPSERSAQIMRFAVTTGDAYDVARVDVQSGSITDVSGRRPADEPLDQRRAFKIRQ